ncbi:MAG TPA: sugar isomerase [Candidatus Omnitrophica bacterium]|nr:sugar isomerase [Candidatus Omnitrophota bacterium]
MRVDKSRLSTLERKYSGYLEGEIIDEFFEEFNIKFAAGHWCAGGFADRFAPGGYSDRSSFASDVISQMERVKKSGIGGIEFHDTLFLDEEQKIDDEKVRRIKEALIQFGLIPTNMNNDLWSKPEWKFGGIAHPVREVREKALSKVIQSIEIAKDIGCTSVALWPGSDGWDYNFQANYKELFRSFVDGCTKINEEAMKGGLRFGLEAKLHEPREGNMVIPTTHFAGLVVKEVNNRCGGNNMGVCIDYGHEQMYAVEPAATLYGMVNFGIPVVNFHINTAKTHSNDEDRITGTGDIWKMVEFCYAAIDTGYDGWFGEDQFTYRMEPVKAMGLSKEIFANIMKKALLIYTHREELLKAQASGDAGNTIDVVKKYIISG